MVLFVHIPKTGGTSIEKTLVSQGALEALNFGPPFAFTKLKPQHLEGEVLQAWIPNSFYDYAFCVVRNPYERLVSEYFWRQSISEQKLPEFSNWFEKKFGRFEKNPYVLRNHIRPQSDFLVPSAEVFRLEDGLSAPIERALAALELPGIGDSKVKHRRKSRPIQVDVTLEQIEKIKDFYAQDFEKFGYSPDDIPELLHTV